MQRVFSPAVIAAACTALLLAISPARVLAACPGTATGQLTAVGHGEAVAGTINGGAHSAGFAGVIFATINGQPNVPAFCINLLNPIGVGDCFNTGGPTSPQITWLLNHGFGPNNSLSNAENAARQAAVWYFSDSFVTTDSHQARVQQIINAVPADPDPQQDVPEMHVDPPSAVNVLPGNSVHSLTLNVTTGGEPLVGQVVNLSTSFGTLSSGTVTTDGTGSATFTVTNTMGTPGTANITATFTYPLPAGTIFNPVVEGKQKLVLAAPTSANLVANATKQWVTGGTIIAHKFLDSNLDTTQDPDEPNLSNWTMKLFACNAACNGTGCTLVAGAAGTKTTDANGDANFGAKAAGCYRVDEVFPTPLPDHQGWHNTTSASQLFMLASNQAEQVVFGNIIYSVIVVQKFADLNGDGVQQGNEPYLDDWRMMLQRLVSGTWIPLKEDLTSGGQVVFSDLPPGHYRIEEELQTDWVNTTGNPVEFDVGSDSIVNLKFGNKPPTCDDSNPCTDDSFDLANGCMHANNTGPCDDLNACTQTDVCQSGICTGGNSVTCTASDQCHNAGTCNPGTGTCSDPPKADGTTCSDGNLCTLTDTCQGGTCAGNQVTCAATDQCHMPGTCNPNDGQCSNPAQPNGTQCNDGDQCTQNDQCSGGACGGTQVSCDDGNVCNGTETCNAQTGCAPGTPLSCNDNNACNGTETCNAQTGCVPGAPLNCDDNNACTQDGCNAAEGQCVNDPVPLRGTGCDDGQFCTMNDVCLSGVCTGTARSCADSSACTTDRCDEAADTCVQDPAPLEGTGCDDGQFCTVTDVCTAGVCTGTQRNCSDNIGCTNDSCDEAVNQCVHLPVLEGGLCDDGLFCTVNEICTSGVCGGGTARDCTDTSTCTADSCDEGANQCVHAGAPFEGTPCSDGNACTEGDHCSAGACTAAPLDCSDSIPCTVDTCDPVSGCQHSQGPGAGCLSPQRSILVVREGTSVSKNKLIWKWLKGPADITRFGDPSASTEYALCVWDQSQGGTVSRLAMQSIVPSGALWQKLGGGTHILFRYKERDATGQRKILLKAFANDTGRIGFKTTGDKTSAPVPVGPTLFAADDAVVVQLISSEGKCWESRFAAPAKQRASLYKDKCGDLVRGPCN